MFSYTDVGDPFSVSVVICGSVGASLEVFEIVAKARCNVCS